jgi:DNA repair ATPase RecN
MASVVNHGADSGVLIENMSSRIQKLEQAMVDDADLFNSFTQERGAPGSPSRFGNQGKKSLNRIRRIEEHLFEIESQIKENETDIDQLKQSLMRKFRGRSESPVRQKGSEASASEVKDLEKKIKKLAESTTKACRSLSTGLTDVQQATLSLYSWTDRVHDSFEVIAQKINLPTNLCPRAKLSNNQNNNNNRRLAGFDF